MKKKDDEGKNDERRNGEGRNDKGRNEETVRKEKKRNIGVWMRTSGSISDAQEGRQ